MNQIFFAKRNYPLHDDEFIHFQNLKNLTMDQFFFSQKKKPSILFARRNKNFERKKEEKKEQSTFIL